MGPISEAELEALPEKTKKDRRVMQMYLQNGYLDAYARHTDLRVAENGYKAAVGAEKDWERHGKLQLAFLRSQGLLPEHNLLEVGCGTGRLARQVVPYLWPHNYIGVDISDCARMAAHDLAIAEGWHVKHPSFLAAIPRHVEFRFAWAFSVFIHLPWELMGAVLTQVHAALKPDGQFFFSYVPEKVSERTGLKQFRHTLEDYQEACALAGLTMEHVPSWKAEQKVAVAMRRT